jgi:Fe-S cluster assembly ATP-binding protein
VDVVPLSKQLFRILRLLNISQKSKLGKTLQTFYAGNHSFSRPYVLRVLRQMENEIKKIMKVKVNEINHLRTPQRLKERINLIKKIKNTWKFKWSNISKLSGLSYQGWIKKTLSGRIKNPSESRMRRLIDSIIAYSDFLEKRILLAKGMIEKIKQIVSSDLFFDKITVIQKVKSKKYVYDLEIKHNNQKIENFVVFPGCFIAHNSTLAHTILGNPKYKITEGKIFFEGKEINKFPPEKRVKLGLSLAWQSPPVIKGVKLSQLLKKISKRKIEIREVKGLLEREINLDFSGGEKKISELLQVISLNPKFVIFDEIDSGLDIKRLEIVSEIIKKELLNKNVSILLITHWGQILDYLKPDLTNVMLNGRIICQEKDFKKVLEVIKKYGYEKCKECPKLLAD